MTTDDWAATENRVRRSTWALMAARDVKVEDVAASTGIPRSTLYRRLRSKTIDQAFRAHEVAAIADYFGVPVEALYSGLGGLVGVTATGTDGRADTGRYPRPSLTLVVGQGPTPQVAPDQGRFRPAERPLVAV